MNNHSNKPYKFFVGKRKEAVARLRLYTESRENLMLDGEALKKGDMVVNNKRIENYFSGIVSKAVFEEPFKITNTLGSFILTAKVEGGGPKSQLEAFVHAVSRALSELDDKNRQILKKKGFLTRDSRVRERRKVGMGGKSRRQKQSPKR